MRARVLWQVDLFKGKVALCLQVLAGGQTRGSDEAVGVAHRINCLACKGGNCFHALLRGGYAGAATAQDRLFQ